jgi:hypothetical protein
MLNITIKFEFARYLSWDGDKQAYKVMPNLFLENIMK